VLVTAAAAAAVAAAAAAADIVKESPGVPKCVEVILLADPGSVCNCL
jgi:hypothetical protein